MTKQGRTLTRRDSLKSAFLLGLAMNTGIAPGGAAAQQSRTNSKVLVTYFSRTGNTRVIAGQIRRALAADLFEIQPAQPYPEDYQEVVNQAQRERDSGYQPPLSARAPNIESYDTIFLGFPIWGMSVPAVIRSFLSSHELAGKTLIPFITHGGYGLGDSRSVITRHAPRARVREAFSLQADQERETLARVSRWLSGARIAG
jgi:flavodoxin